MTIFVVLVTLLSADGGGRAYNAGSFPDALSCEKARCAVSAVIPTSGGEYEGRVVAYSNVRCVEVKVSEGLQWTR